MSRSDVRLGSKTNYLVLKDDVGKAKPTTRNLPPEEFSYGKTEKTKQEGAGIITSSWLYHQSKTSDDKHNPRDFKKLNKFAVVGGMVTSKDNYEFRKTHDARIPFGLGALKNKDVCLPGGAFRYGRANRPQTPVKGIILNQYGETAKCDIQEKYRVIKEYKRANSPTNNKFDIRYTNAQMKHDEFVKTQSAFDYLNQERQ